MAVYASVSISKAALWESGWAAVKLGATGYIVPFMFAFSPALLMIGPWDIVTVAIITALIGVICLASSLHGFLLVNLGKAERTMLLTAAILLIKPGPMTDAIGGLLVLFTVISQMRKLSKQMKMSTSS